MRSLAIDVQGVMVLAGTAWLGLLAVHAWARRAGHLAAASVLWWALLAAWAAAVAAITLTPVANDLGTRPVSLIPMSDISELLTSSVTWRVPVAQIAGNVGMFVPLGVLIVLRGSTAWRALAWGTIAACGIEALQWVLNTGRVCSVDDALLAAAGAGLGSVVALALRTYARARRASNSPAIAHDASAESSTP